MKKALIVCLLAAAVSMAQRQRVVVLPSIADPETKFSARELDVLTEKLRGHASDVLPLGDFLLLKQDYVREKLGDEALFEACKEGTCVGDLIAMVQANFGARCDVFSVKGKLWLKFELYGTLRDEDDAGTISTFSEEVRDLKAMLAAIEKKVPDAFRKILSDPAPAAQKPSPANETKNKAEAYNKRGFAYANKGDYSKAISDYTEAIRLNPKYADAYYNRGVEYFEKGYYDLAIADWKSVLRIAPNDIDAKNALSDAQKALESKTAPPPAKPAAPAAGGTRNDAEAYYKKGVEYFEKGDHDRAISDFTQAILFNPNYAEAYSKRGMAYGNKGDYGRAISDFTEAIQLDRDVNAYYNRGNAYLYKKDYDRAIADYESALRIDPNHSGAKEALQEQADEPRGVRDFYKAVARGLKFYISPKYQLPVGAPLPGGIALALGLGWIWRSGVFFGIDGNLGIYKTGSGDAAGSGLSLGYSHDLPSHFKLAYGGSLGLWESHSHEYDSDTHSTSIVAPFVKLRWRYLEASYKIFLGITEEHNHYSGYESKEYFGVTMHELAIGFYFGGW